MTIKEDNKNITGQRKKGNIIKEKQNERKVDINITINSLNQSYSIRCDR